MSVVALVVVGIVFTVNLNEKDEDGQVAAGQEEQEQQEEKQNEKIKSTVASVPGVNTFSEKTDASICSEDGKPVVYLFSTTWCPHCEWISDTFDATVKKYIDEDKIVAYHWELDINDNTLTDNAETQVPNDHLAVYQEFNPQGSIPTFVFGCKYFRIGNGYERQNDLDAEQAEFEALIEDLIE